MIAGTCTAEGMSHDDYLGDPCDTPSLNASTATALVTQCPAHAYLKHPRLGGAASTPTEEQTMGSLVHDSLLGQPSRIVVVEADSFRTKLAKEARDRAIGEGKHPMLEHKLVAYDIKIAKIRAQLEAQGISLQGGFSELSMFFEQDGVQCRSRPDHVASGSALITELKTCQSAHPKAIRAHVEQYGYDIQRHCQIRAVAANRPELEGRVEHRWVFLEMRAPYLVQVVHAGGSMRELGSHRWNEAVRLWKECLQKDKWPGYSEEPVTVEASSWALEEMELA